MDGFFSALTHNPMHYISYAFAFFGGLGMLLFLSGWGSGMPHIFTFSESQHHMDHARARAVWGILLCMVTLGWWEIVRVITGEAPLTYLWLSLALLTPLWIPWLKKLAAGGGGGH
jgi:hypothetical protein